ncbi:MAG: NTP transferase domain-containing protein [Hungatella sp.]|nr:NTP transferase domain-containing protein [Hungatella sp.]
MKKTDKNIVMITAGGVGQRFGTEIPKQYFILDGKPVIEYVVDACKKCEMADAILIVAAAAYHEQLHKKYGVDVTDSGSELNETKRNGFDYIEKHSSCEKLIVVEAVRPFLEVEVLYETFKLLDKYDAVACARKITDSLGKYGKWIVNREDYYTLNPPEGFRFALLNQYFKADSSYTESIQQLPETSKIYLNFEVPYFDKITYPDDLFRAEAMMKLRKQKIFEEE